MAVSLLANVVLSDLCLGKPALKFLRISATVSDALEALKNSDDNFISVWDCVDRSAKIGFGDGNDGAVGDECRCIGKVCMVDVICYLCKNENSLPPDALKAPVSAILPKIPGLVRHLEPSSSLLEAIDLILQGAQNLVVPIQTKLSCYARRKQLQKCSTIGPSTTHNGREFCWLTQEDVIRFLLCSIGLFSPIPALSIDTLGIITTDILAVDYFSSASSALGAISRSLAKQTSVAVVDGEGSLIGEISPLTLACCHETVAEAIMTLSTEDLMAFIDRRGPPEDLVRVVKSRLKEKNLEGMLEEFNILSASGTSSSSSSDEDYSSLSPPRPGRYCRSTSYSGRMVRRTETIVCQPKSSLVAVMIKAIAHRVNYVWVIEDDRSLVGLVTFCDILKVFREQLDTRKQKG